MQGVLNDSLADFLVAWFFQLALNPYITVDLYTWWKCILDKEMRKC